METVENVLEQRDKSRKRKQNCETWKKFQKKKQCNSKENKVCKVNCDHAINSKTCQAASLSPELVEKISNTFYSGNKEQQDSFILKNLSSSAPERRSKSRKEKQRDISIKYFLPVNEDQTIPVCAKSFVSVLGVGKDRVINIVKYWLIHNTPRPENRGGARINTTVAAKTEKVMNHIKRFTCTASHYGRSKSPNRLYLSSNLSIRSMWKLFKDEGNEDFTYKFYYNVFVTHFNLGFGSPATDVCSDCVRFGTILKSDADDEDKKKVAAQLWIHNVSAKRFYTTLNDFDPKDLSVRTIVFDLMQNQPLPKTPIGEAFYSRQLWQYFFGIVDHHGKDKKQSKSDVYFYSWGEHEAGRGSNSMVSAIFDYITKYVPPEVKTLRLFSDSCPGQNKNYAMIAMLSSLAKERGYQILYYFPIRGHSYLPADRAFGRVEQILRKNETILTPLEYFEIFSRVGIMKILNQDFELYDWKKYQQTTLKSQHTFKISEARVLELNGLQVGQKNNFFGHFEYHSILGRGKKFLPRTLIKLPSEHHVTQEKKDDVNKLLKQIGIEGNHPDLPFYNNALRFVAPSKQNKN